MGNHSDTVVLLLFHPDAVINACVSTVVEEYHQNDRLLGSSFSIANQIKFDLRFTDLRLT